MTNNYNPSTQENEIERMKQLMGYGLNESKAHESGNSSVAFHQVGPDGNTYGIVNECNKFYIKVAPKKDSEILAEDYDYIGGYMNKKEYEYPSYTVAYKQFGLKMKSLNEAYTTKEKKNKVVLDKPIEPAEWQVNETKEMRQEINRFNQLMNNVDYILSEGKELDGKALQLGDKDVDENGGNAYQEKPTPENKVNSMKTDAPSPEESDNTYSEKPMSVDEINKMKETAKDPKTADKTYNKTVGKTLKLTNEQAEKVLAWSQDKNYMDTTHGTEIGDGAPYDETTRIGNQTNEAVYNSEDMNQHTGDAKKYMEPFDDKVDEEIDDENGVMLVDNEQEPSPEYEVEVDTQDDDFVPIEDKDFQYGNWNDMTPEQQLDFETRDDMEYYYESVVNRVVKNILNEVEGVPHDDVYDTVEKFAYENCDKMTYQDFYKQAEKMGLNDKRTIDGIWNNACFHSRSRQPKTCGAGYPIGLKENKLDVFGKHPAWHKQPMTTPPNFEPSKFGKEWDDDSVKGSEPFATHIGHGGDPYTEHVIDMLTDSVIDKLLGNTSRENSKKKV